MPRKRQFSRLERTEDRPADIILYQLQALNPLFMIEFDVKQLIVMDDNTLRLHTRGSRGTINVDIRYDKSSDTYSVKAYRINGMEATEVFGKSGVYVDGLSTQCLTQSTG